ncbi:MAG: hypothetical protein D6800_04330 [Candidatus Zixiibacteriota bacterium]|nr:MAG: hypothetical protein D6800_04330 [candidate division Zixibacteria bacterium]
MPAEVAAEVTEVAVAISRHKMPGRINRAVEGRLLIWVLYQSVLGMVRVSLLVPAVYFPVVVMRKASGGEAFPEVLRKTQKHFLSLGGSSLIE